MGIRKDLDMTEWLNNIQGTHSRGGNLRVLELFGEGIGEKEVEV